MGAFQAGSVLYTGRRSLLSDGLRHLGGEIEKIFTGKNQQANNVVGAARTQLAKELADAQNEAATAAGKLADAKVEPAPAVPRYVWYIGGAVGFVVLLVLSVVAFSSRRS